MKVNWKNAETNQSPILFKHRVEWAGFSVNHWRVTAGELVEQSHPAHEISVTLGGSIVTEKHTPTGAWRRRQNEPGSICFNPAGQLFRGNWETELECFNIVLDPNLVSQAALEQDFPGSVELVETGGRSDPLVQQIGLALLAEGTAQEPFGRLYAESLAQVLVLHLLKNYSTANAPTEGAAASGGLSAYRLRRAKDFIEAHLERDFSLAELAEAAGFSRFHFARAFRRSTGVTPRAYVTQRRVIRAKELLTNGDLPIVEVSLRLGFKSQSHFTTLFRKFTAHTPKSFREARHR